MSETTGCQSYISFAAVCCWDFGFTYYSMKFLVQVWLRAELLCTLSSTQPGFKLMTSRSWQNISCHLDTYSNHLAISDFTSPICRALLTTALIDGFVLDLCIPGTGCLPIRARHNCFSQGQRFERSQQGSSGQYFDWRWSKGTHTVDYSRYM